MFRWGASRVANLFSVEYYLLTCRAFSFSHGFLSGPIVEDVHRIRHFLHAWHRVSWMYYGITVARTSCSGFFDLFVVVSSRPYDDFVFCMHLRCFIYSRHYSTSV